MDQGVIEWLLGDDVSIRCQTRRVLLDGDLPELPRRIANEGWGARLR
jgi:hypothetical protein